MSMFEAISFCSIRILASFATAICFSVGAAHAEKATSDFDWSGPYAGLQFGGAVDGDTESSIVGFPGSTTGSLEGVLGGVLGGYNFQKGNIVFGLDGEFSLTGIDGELAGGEIELITLSTTRLRAGYAFDRVLPYVTGGVAYGFAEAQPAIGNDDTEFNFGWTVGAGIEYAVTENINARIQYNYVDLGEETYDLVLPTDIEIDNLHLIRAGVSIRTDFIWDKILGR